MQQFSENDLNKALGELDRFEHAMGTDPMLRPDEITRITDLNKETDPEVKAEKTLALMDELMAWARKGQQEMDQQEINRFLGGDHFDARSKQLLQDALAGYKSKILAEVEARAKLAVAPKPSRRVPRAGRLMI